MVESSFRNYIFTASAVETNVYDGIIFSVAYIKEVVRNALGEPACFSNNQEHFFVKFHPAVLMISMG